MNAPNRALEYEAEIASGRPFSLDLSAITDGGGELIGYRLHEPQGPTSRLYLSREDALDAWVNRQIEWEY